MSTRQSSSWTYQLRNAEFPDENGNHGRDALAWLSGINPSWTNPDGSACIERIARSAGINSSTLQRIYRRRMELNAQVMAALVGISGKPRADAEAQLFQHVELAAADGFGAERAMAGVL
jgi:AraC-like DNA-binding protein